MNNYISLVTGINHILHAALSADTEEVLGRVCLEVAENVTGSRFGFIMELREDGLLHSIAFSKSGMKANSLTEESGYSYPPGPFSLHGIYGRVVKDGKGFFTNEPGSHPDSVGIPAGHPPLNSFLSVPIISSGSVAGIVAVANREDGYGQEHLEILEALAPSIEEALSRRRMEDALRKVQNTLAETQKIAHIGSMEYNVITGRITGSDEQYRIYGLDPSQSPPDFGDILARKIYPEDIELLKETLIEVVKNSSVFELEHRIVRQDGNVRWVFTQAQPYFDDNGKLTRYIGTTQDITERKEAENEIRELNISLEQKIKQRTEELYESEKRYRMAMDAAGEGLWEWNLKTDEVVINNQYYGLFGYAVGEVIPSIHLWESMLHPDDAAKVRSDFDDYLHGRTAAYNNLHRVITSTGEIRWHKGNGKVVERDVSGNPLRMVGTTRDVTEQVLAEEALKKSEENFRHIFNNTGDALIINSLDTRFIEVNDVMCEKLGYSRDEFYRMTASDIDVPEYAELIPERLMQLQQTGNLVFETAHRAKDGTITPVEMHTRMIKYNGEPALLSTIRDITGRKHAEKALRESEERFSRFMANLPASVFIKDEKGGVVYLNQHLCDLMGFKNWRGKTDFDLIPGDVALRVTDDDRKAMEQGYLRLEETMTDAKGINRFFDTIKFPILIEGKAPMIGGIAIDITDRKINELMIKGLLKDKEIILKEVHHRMKNFMIAIKSLIQLHIASINNSSAQSFLHDVESRINSMMILYEKLYVKQNIHELSIREYLVELLDNILFNFPRNKNINLIKNIDDFILDPAILQPLGIIVNELITNSIKYAFPDRDGGDITITVRCNNKHVTVEIRDNGIGIPESISFEKTTGFGMQLVQMLTEQISGSIRLEHGNGTGFMLEFDI